jgi:hypothetical protein
VPAVAEARPPRISQPPAISGTPQVGVTLVAEGAEWDPRSGTTATWQWYRCESPGQGGCRAIGGATSTSYLVSEADLGKYVRVLLSVRNGDGWAWSLSATSAAITSRPPPAEPEPVVEPSPEPQPVPRPAPVANPEPVAPAGGVREEQATLRLMDPAPVVRIRGRLTRSGARITLLTVRAPRGARVTVRCLGRGCPARHWARPASLTRVTRFQAALPAGTRLVITVTKPGRIGKHTVIAVRRGAAPTRRDRCVMPGARKPVRCPGA